MEQMKGMKGDGFSDGATSLANALWPPTQGGAPRGGLRGLNMRYPPVSTPYAAINKKFGRDLSASV